MKIVFKKTEMAQGLALVNRVSTMLNEKFDLQLPIAIGTSEDMIELMDGMQDFTTGIIFTETDTEFSIEYTEEFLLDSMAIMESVINHTADFIEEHKFVIKMVYGGVKVLVDNVIPAILAVCEPLVKPFQTAMEKVGEIGMTFAMKWFTPFRGLDDGVEKAEI
jgi:hypothetical protein